MTTYGPSTMSLAERLLAADVVACAVSAKLVRTTVDELSESRRELGTFSLTLTDVLRGQPPETVEVLVARAQDEPWPLPEEGEFLVLLQSTGQNQWVLVHNSAFPLHGSNVDFDPRAGLTQARRELQTVTLQDVAADLADQDKHSQAYAAAEKEYETSPIKSGDGPAVQEMPGDGLSEWLDLDRGPGGRPG
uniref:hypothetical protein n=1 Tax=Arthrobacter globiformis TaxID=1665 RepID=UPI001124DB96